MWVRCQKCDVERRVSMSRGTRLAQARCPECGGRLRNSSWYTRQANLIVERDIAAGARAYFQRLIAAGAEDHTTRNLEWGCKVIFERREAELRKMEGLAS